MNTKPLLSIACGALVALTLPVIAQDAPAKKPPLTRDQYRACLDSGDKIEARAEDIKARTDKLKAEIEAVSAEYDELKKDADAQKGEVTVGEQRRFERRKAANAARWNATEDAKKALAGDIEGYRKDVDAYNARCSNVQVFPEDQEAVQKERAAAGKK